jgi:hypothetical protein
MTAQDTPQPQSQEVPIIPARRNGVTMLCIQTFLAIMAGLALRLLFVYRFPGSAGDSDTYLQLANNWADHHVYGLWLGGHLVPTDLRMPGYPAFLAAVGMVLGRSINAISLSQTMLDLGTCCLTAALGAALAPVRARRAVWLAGVWLAATCPFVANYTAVVLTEVLVTFLSTAALVCFVIGLRERPSAARLESDPGRSERGAPSITFAALGAFLTGVATLVRPEMPLLLVAAALVYALRAWGSCSFRKMVLMGGAMAGAVLLPLIPWAARNYVTLHEKQMLAPRYATLPGEYAPVGYFAWTRTWLERYRDVYLSIWTIGEEPLAIDDLPPRAFDSQEEKYRVSVLLNEYNTSDNLDISPEMDHEFAELARQRTVRHPLRTYIEVPFQRALTIWFTPRTELLPIDGKIWPLVGQWRDSPADVLTTAGFAVLGYLYVFLAMCAIGVALSVARQGAGTGGMRNMYDSLNLWGIAVVLVSLVLRTIFLTTVEAPEPRYVVSCYPAVLALIALLVAGRRRKESQ